MGSELNIGVDDPTTHVEVLKRSRLMLQNRNVNFEMILDGKVLFY